MTEGPTFAITLDEAARADALTIGNKAAGLGKLAAAGFEVPPAFCIPCSAYLYYMEASGLAEMVGGLEDELNAALPPHVRELSEKIIVCLKSSEIPPEMQKEVVQFYTALLGSDDGKQVSVRSSPAVSLPGQYQTVLRVSSEVDLFEAIKEVWASYWTEQAIVARRALAIPQLPVQLGVVVQEMVEPEFAGILFTADQPSGDPTRIVIESVAGLGDSLALGHSKPDSIVVAKPALRIIERTSMSRGTASTAPTLKDGDVVDLCRVALEAEASFGCPIDMEWAFKAGRFFILQARPIRGLQDEEQIEPSRDELSYSPAPARPDTVWTRYWADNFLRGVFTPGGYAFVIWWCEAMNSAVDQARGYSDVRRVQMFRYYRGRAYMNTDYLKRRAQYEPRSLRTSELLNHFPSAERQAVASLPFYAWKRVFGELRVLFLRRDQLIFRNHRFFQQESRHILEEARTHLDAIDLRSATLQDLFRYRRLLRRLVFRHEDGYVGWIFEYKASLDGLLSKILETWYGPGWEEMFQRLVSGVPENITVRISLALWDLSRIVRSNPALLERFENENAIGLWSHVSSTSNEDRFRKAFDQFLLDYGDRRESLDLYRVPDWGEDPTQVLSMLKAMVRLPDGRSPGDDLDAQVKRREEATRNMERLLRSQRWGWMKVRLFRSVLNLSLAYAACRENQRFVADTLISRYRRMLLTFGDRLVVDGLLQEREDVFFLSEPEVLHVVKDGTARDEVGRKVNSRKSAFARNRVLPPLFIRGHSQELPAAPEPAATSKGEVVLHGTPASPGIASGPVRVLEDLSGVDALKDGEVLVASSIDPGWTTAFPIISAVVTEIGGALSHGAIMAREFGIPAVIGVEGAMAQLADGQTVTVDGHTGKVTPGHT